MNKALEEQIKNCNHKAFIHNLLTDRRECLCGEVSMEREENKHKANLIKQFRLDEPEGITLAHQDLRTGGIPDISHTNHGSTKWLECKHGNPDFDSTGLQELTMKRLAAKGFARYIIWLEEADGTNRRTLIVHPNNLKTLSAEETYAGFNHKAVVDYISRVRR